MRFYENISGILFPDGSHRRVAEEIRNSLDGDIEEIFDTTSRSGILGWLKAGRDGTGQKLTVIKDITIDPSQYDLLIIGTPVWSNHVSAAIRTYIHQNHANFNNVAFFCTANRNFGTTLEDLQELSGTLPLATLGVMAKEVKDESFKSKVAEFSRKIQ